MFQVEERLREMEQQRGRDAKHHPGDAAPIDTTDDPDKERELMGDFMDAQDITWMIAFSKQSVFNVDFGVKGIPHVAILDAKGIVRHNGLHPMDPLAEKVEKINKLLKEAGLKTAPEVKPEVEEEKTEEKAEEKE